MSYLAFSCGDPIWLIPWILPLTLLKSPRALHTCCSPRNQLLLMYIFIPPTFRIHERGINSLAIPSAIVEVYSPISTFGICCCSLLLLLLYFCCQPATHSSLPFTWCCHSSSLESIPGRFWWISVVKVHTHTTSTHSLLTRVQSSPSTIPPHHQYSSQSPLSVIVLKQTHTWCQSSAGDCLKKK